MIRSRWRQSEFITDHRMAVEIISMSGIYLIIARGTKLQLVLTISRYSHGNNYTCDHRCIQVTGTGSVYLFIYLQECSKCVFLFCFVLFFVFVFVCFCGFFVSRNDDPGTTFISTFQEQDTNAATSDQPVGLWQQNHTKIFHATQFYGSNGYCFHLVICYFSF